MFCYKPILCWISYSSEEVLQSIRYFVCWNSKHINLCSGIVCWIKRNIWFNSFWKWEKYNYLILYYFSVLLRNIINILLFWVDFFTNKSFYGWTYFVTQHNFTLKIIYWYLLKYKHRWKINLCKSLLISVWRNVLCELENLK